jgi:peptidyl-prolyl cis-trans isomerase A (cyclophilin A)
MAPDDFTITFSTTKGEFKAAVHRSWSPNGADRLYEMVQDGFFTDIAFFRVIDGFVAQFGIHGDPAVAAEWRARQIPDDEVVASNTAGTISFAMAGPGTRTTQLFLNLVDNSRLDSMGFSPVAEVTEGMDVVNAIHAGYGEGAPRGRGPDQGRIQAQGNEYLKAEFPELDYVESASISE